VAAAGGVSKNYGFTVLINGPYGALLRTSVAQTLEPFEISVVQKSGKHVTFSAVPVCRLPALCLGRVHELQAAGVIPKQPRGVTTLETNTGAYRLGGRGSNYGS